MISQRVFGGAFGLVALLIGSSLAKADGFAIGPWRLNMSKAEVSSFHKFGPYAPVRLTDGLETANGVFLDETRNVSFVFDDQGLKYIQAWEYEGQDLQAAKGGVQRIFDLFQRDFGGATIDGVEIGTDGNPKPIDSEALSVVLAELLDRAERLGNAAEEEGFAMILLLDMRPIQQPESSRVHCQWGYASRYKTYYVFLYQDRLTNPRRGAATMMRLEKL